MQIPYQDELSIMAVEKYMAAHRWDYYGNIGDFLDFDTISSFNKGKPKNQMRPIWEDIKQANNMLDRHQAIIRKKNRKAEFFILEGNHEERLNRWLEENPTFEGMWSVPQLLKLKERDIEWIPSWSKGAFKRIGKANFLHGNYTNQYHPAKMATKYGDNVFYGHTHDVMSHTVANHLSPEQSHVGQSIGCLCERNLSYMKGQPSNWQQGFAVFFFKENGTFTYYTPRIFNHQFVGPDGVLYHP